MRSKSLILLTLTISLAASSCGRLTYVPEGPQVCPKWPDQPQSSKTFLREKIAVRKTIDGETRAYPAPGSESTWAWLSELAVLHARLDICRGEPEGE